MKYRHNPLANADEMVEYLKQKITHLGQYKFSVYKSSTVGLACVSVDFFQVPPNASDLDTWNAKAFIKVTIEEAKGLPSWKTDAPTPAKVSATVARARGPFKFRAKSGTPEKVVDYVIDWFQKNVPVQIPSPRRNPAVTPKPYKCTQCGYITTQNTNHTGPTWSVGRVNVCPHCPPYKKYPEYGGRTDWECLSHLEKNPETKALPACYFCGPYKNDPRLIRDKMYLACKKHDTRRRATPGCEEPGCINIAEGRKNGIFYCSVHYPRTDLSLSQTVELDAAAAAIPVTKRNPLSAAQRHEVLGRQTIIENGQHYDRKAYRNYLKLNNSERVMVCLFCQAAATDNNCINRHGVAHRWW